jgi:hypothetical protein
VIGFRRISIAAMLALAMAAPRAALADSSSIEQIVAKNLTPDVGGTVTFQIAVTPDDNLVWAAGSYSVTLTASDPSGNVVASGSPVAAPEAATPQQTTMVFADLALPPGYLGPLVVHAQLIHGKESDTSLPVGIVVGGSAGVATIVPAASPPPGQVPAPGVAATPSAAPPPPVAHVPVQSYNGSLALNAGFAAQQTHSGTLNMTGKYSNNQSVTTSLGLADTPGATKPIFSYQTPATLLQIGTFSPAYDRDVLAGPTGSGFGFKEQYGPTNFLQGAYISGNHDTTNPFEVSAVQYGFPLRGSSVTVTGAYTDVYGPAQTGGPYFLRDGTFFGFGDDVTAKNSTITYGIHYGMSYYLDDISGSDQFGQVFDTSFGFAIRKTHFAFTYVRATPAFSNSLAPSITPDQENESAAINFPLGVLQITLGLNVYRNDLPGSTAVQTTHYSTENIGVTYPLKNGDTLSLQGVNGIQHQTGTPVAPFSGNDGTTFAYTTKRGPYAVQYTLTDTETRDDSGNLLHVMTDGITVSRTPFAGITISGGYNLNQNDANSDTMTSVSNSATASISYTRGSFTFSTQLNHALTLPAFGLASPPTTTYNYGLSVKPPHSPYSVSATVTENIGMINTSVGALSLNRQF